MSIATKIRSSLATKLTLFLIAVLLLCLGTLTALIAVSTSNSLIDEQQTKLTLLAHNNAVLAKEAMEAAVNKQEVVLTAIESAHGLPEELQASTIKETIHSFNQSEPDTLSAYYIDLASSATPVGTTIYSTGGDSGQRSSTTVMLTQAQVDSLSNLTAMTIMDPYTKEIDGKNYQVVTVVNPMLNAQGKVSGLVCSDIDINLVNGAAYQTGNYQSFYNLIICGHKTVISNTQNPETIGQPYANIASSSNPQLILDVATNATESTFVDMNTDGTSFYRACVPFYVGGSKTVWVSCTSVSRADFMAPIIQQLLLVISVSVVTLVLLALCIFLSLRRSMAPVRQMMHAANEMSKGNLQVRIEHTGQDEIGSLANSLRTSMTVINDYIQDIDRAMGEMSNGNFDLGPSNPFIGDFEGIERSITNFIISISNAMHRVNQSSTFVSSSALELANGSTMLAEGATEQAASVEELSSTIAELTEQIRRNAQHASQAKIETSATAVQVEASNQKMQQMIGAMDEINMKSTEISKIIKTIEDIAFQTNILALNAAVEAARAGSAGKGFAVVADEVRNLAGKSAEAAKNTTTLIGETVRAVENGAHIVDDTATTLHGVVEGAMRVTQLIDEIASESDLQADAIAGISQGVDEISRVVQTNSATAEETAAASEELNGQADVLRTLVARFRIKEAVLQDN